MCLGSALVNFKWKWTKKQPLSEMKDEVVVLSLDEAAKDDKGAS